MLRMWRHIKMVKRGGRSYDHSGIDGTSPGELAVLCPACPIPSINLPPNWQSVGKDLEYVNLPFVRSFSQTPSIPGISITRHLALTPAFGSRGDRFQTMKRTLSWVLAAHILLRGSRIANISVPSPISKRFVSFVLWHSTLRLIWMTHR
jgi:hypothetical protein